METLKARAILQVRHNRAIDFDSSKGLWVYQPGEIEEVGNILTDAGRVSIHTFIYGTAAQRTAAVLGSGLHFIGLSNDAAAPAAGDTSLSGELVADGLERAEGTVTLPTGSGAITTIQHEFTYTGGGTQGVQKTALFDDLAGGNMAHEILFTQRTLATNDTLTLTFNITVS